MSFASLYLYVHRIGSSPGTASQAAIVSVLSNLQELCEEDPSLEAALRGAQIVTDGGGEPAQVSDLFDPAIDELLGLLGPEAFPSQAFCTPAVSSSLVVFVACFIPYFSAFFLICGRFVASFAVGIPPSLAAVFS